MKKLLFATAMVFFSLPVFGQATDEVEAAWDKPGRLSGLYVEHRTGTRMLHDRMIREPLSVRRIEARDDQSLRYKGRIYRRAEPFLYRADNGETLAFAITGGGPFIFFAESARPYRKSFFAANPRLVLYPAPIAFFILLTAAPYLYRRFPPSNRKLAAFSVAGALLFAGGILLELNFYQLIVLEAGFSWPHYFWRALTNLGAIALLVTPMFALSIRKRMDFAAGPFMPLQSLHITLIGLAGLVLFILGVFWGVIGEFRVYF